MNTNVAYNTYAQNNVSIESPYKLVTMMYEGILRFNTRAKCAIEQNDIEKRTYWIDRSSAIFTELSNPLNMQQGEISYYLEGLYTYELQLLSQANLHNDVTKLDEVNAVIKQLLEAWRDETAMA